MTVNPSPLKVRFSWKTLVSILVSCAFLWAALRRVQGTELVRGLSGADWRWLLVALGLFGMGGLFASARLHLMLALTDGDVHPGATIRLFHIGRFFNLLLFGPAAGDLARSALYSRWFGTSLPKVLAAAPLDRLLGLAGLIALVTVGVAIGGASGAFSGFGERQRIEWGVYAMVALGAAVLFVYLLGKLDADSGVGRVRRHFLDGARTLWRHPRRAARGLALGFMVQATMGGVMACCLLAVRSEATAFIPMIWVFPTITVLTSIPSVAGVGVREAAALTLLGLYGVAEEDAVASSLLFAGCYVSWAALGGMLLWRESRRMGWDSNVEAAGAAISVVIPTWNEAAALPETLRRLRALPQVTEMIVADGGSKDETVEIARSGGCRVVMSEPGRGKQLRAGCMAANGDVVLMLHADTWLPSSAGEAVRKCLRDPSVVGGGFWKDFRDGTWLMAGSRWRCAPRLFLFGRVLGDQGLFVRRTMLERIGGVPDMPLMEEFRLCELFRREGRLALAGATALTSARRFRKHGVLRTYLRMWIITTLYLLGISPEKLRRIYEKS